MHETKLIWFLKVNEFQLPSECYDTAAWYWTIGICSPLLKQILNYSIFLSAWTVYSVLCDIAIVDNVSPN